MPFHRGAYRRCMSTETQTRVGGSHMRTAFVTIDLPTGDGYPSDQTDDKTGEWSKVIAWLGLAHWSFLLFLFSANSAWKCTEMETGVVCLKERECEKKWREKKRKKRQKKSKKKKKEDEGNVVAVEPTYRGKVLKVRDLWKRKIKSSFPWGYGQELNKNETNQNGMVENERDAFLESEWIE